MKKHRFRAVVFDFDLTLADSSSGIVECITYALKHYPEGFLRALTHLAHAPAHVVYVGDHPVDAEAASRAGVPFVAVLTGMAAPSDFVMSQPMGILQDLTELPRLLGT